MCTGAATARSARGAARRVARDAVDRYARAVAQDVKRVCLLGAESTGKTTLAEALAERFDTVWNPEYGRPYTEIGRPRGHPGRAGSSRTSPGSTAGTRTSSREAPTALLFSDTDAFTTAVFHEVYLGTPATGFEELVDRRYDLYLVCGVDVPWRHDGIREFEEQRRWMHERYVAHARAERQRLARPERAARTAARAAADAVDRLLG